MSLRIKDLARAKTGQKQGTLVRTSEHPRNGGAGCRPAFTSKFVGPACSDWDRVSDQRVGRCACAVGYLLVNRVDGASRGAMCSRGACVGSRAADPASCSRARSRTRVLLTPGPPRRKKARRARTLRAQKSPGESRGCQGLGGRSPLPVRPCCARSERGSFGPSRGRR